MSGAHWTLQRSFGLACVKAGVRALLRLEEVGIHCRKRILGRYCVMFASAALHPAFSPCGLGDSTVSKPSDSTFASPGNALLAPAERTLGILDDPSIVREDVPSSSSEEGDPPQQGPSKKSKATEVEESVVVRAASGVCHAGVVREDGLGISLQWSDGRVVTVRPKCGALCQKLTLVDSLVADARRCQHRACLVAFRAAEASSVHAPAGAQLNAA